MKIHKHLKEVVIICSCFILSGCFSVFQTTYNKNLKHCKVPIEWSAIRDNAWDDASRTLWAEGVEPKTECKEIEIERGLKLNPKTKQWGRPMLINNGEELWYAGYASEYIIKIVGDKNGKPYDRSQAIFTHEAAENILSSNEDHRSNDERNKFLWSLGL